MSAPRVSSHAAVPTTSVSPESVIEALRGVADPEIPNVSVVDLGMVGEVEVRSDSIRVELLPTFVGCPALDVIRTDVARAIEGLGRTARVDVSYATPWSSERITALGRERLRASGFAPPPAARDGVASTDLVVCPHCGSDRVTIDSLFGPTQCRSLYYCRGCRQPFEAFKSV